MSEICTCGHHIDDHRETPMSETGICQMPGCDCEEYEGTEDE